MKVTRELMDATKALVPEAAWYGYHSSRMGLVHDVRDRAREISENMYVDMNLAPFQVKYLQLLRSRLNDHCLATFTVAQDWQDAFAGAYARKGN